MEQGCSCRGHSKCKVFEGGYAWVDKESWRQCGWSRVSRGRVTGDELRDAKGAHIGLRDLDLFPMWGGATGGL